MPLENNATFRRLTFPPFSDSNFIGFAVYVSKRTSFIKCHTRAKSGEEFGCSISVTDFWARNCLTESAL
jgi:hypothetical protein